MRLPSPDRAPRKRSETRDIVQPMLRALNRLPGVRVVRNANLGPVVPYARRHEDGIRPILAGLGTGSADVVGMVTVNAYLLDDDVSRIGRVFVLEVKLPAEGRMRGGAPSEDQVRWLATVRRFGGFAAVVTSIDEAREAVARCRAGASE